MTSYDIAYHRSNMTWCVNMILRMWRHMILRIWRHMISRICRSMTYDVIWYTSILVWRNMIYDYHVSSVYSLEYGIRSCVIFVRYMIGIRSYVIFQRIHRKWRNITLLDILCIKYILQDSIGNIIQKSSLEHLL